MIYRKNHYLYVPKYRGFSRITLEQKISNMMKADSAPLMAALILIATIIFFLHRMMKSVGNKSASPPGPLGLPIVGYLPFLRHDLHLQLTEMAAQYGPIYKFYMGNKLVVVISSVSFLKEVVRDHGQVFANRSTTDAVRITSYNFSDVAFAPNGPVWRDRRKIFMREMLSNSKLNATYNLRRDQVRKIITEIYESKIGKPIHIFEMGVRINLNLMVNMVWGGKTPAEHCDRIVAGLIPIAGEILNLIVKLNISDLFPVLARFDLQGVAKKMTDLMRKIEEITKEAIEERMRNALARMEEGGRKDLMDTLASSLDIIQIKAMLMDLLFGGIDVSSAIIEWVMAKLLQDPMLMEKVQHELNEVVGTNNVVEESHIPKLVYLDAILKETMRLRTIGLLLFPKIPSQTCKVGGFTIPKDSMVFINDWLIHRDPLVWDNPSEFRPERFLEGEKAKWDFSGNNLNYIPFGTGRRTCAGLPLAERTISYILALMLHSFEWRLPDGEELDMSDELRFSLRKRVPLVVIPSPRLPCSDLYM